MGPGGTGSSTVLRSRQQRTERRPVLAVHPERRGFRVTGPSGPRVRGEPLTQRDEHRLEWVESLRGAGGRAGLWPAAAMNDREAVSALGSFGALGTLRAQLDGGRRGGCPNLDLVLDVLVDADDDVLLDAVALL